MYFLFALSLGYLLFAVYQRVKLWGLNGFKVNNLLGALQTFLFQRKLVERERTGWSHFFIYFGFVVLVIATTSVFIDYDLGIHIYQGTYYLTITFLSDLAGLLIITLCCVFIYDRFVKNNDSIRSNRSDLALTVGLIVLCVQGFILEGARIVLTDDPWAPYSFVGFLVADFFKGSSSSALTVFHFVNWWIHTLSVFAFFALLVYTKAFHILTSPLNLLLKSVHPRSKYRDLLNRFESGEIDKVGYETVMDLSAKNKLDLDACTSCGRCQEVCPAYISGKPLSPKMLILHQKRKLYEEYAKKQSSNILGKLDQFFTKFLTLSPFETPTNSRSVNEALLVKGDKILGGLFDPNFFWSCTTCNACVESCPVGIDHLEHILETRRFSVVMEGKAPSEASHTLRILQDSNCSVSWRIDRDKFFADLGVRVLKPGESCENLLWVGCISAGDKRKEEILKSIIKIFKHFNVDFAVLGNQEICTGDPARRIGDEVTAQALGHSVRQLLKQFSFKRIISHCPHCVNIMKREFPVDEPGFQVSVSHHSEIIANLLRGKKSPGRNQELFTIHDPCYLARYLSVDEQPREVLSKIGKISEPARNRKKTLCCGAGGGQYFYDLKIGERINNVRFRELESTGAKTIVTMCPFCNQMLSDSASLTNSECKVKDIAEVVAETL